MTEYQYAYRLGWRSLRTVCPNLTEAQAKARAMELAPAMVKFNITNRRRAAMFIAQLAHESLEFHYREEIASGSAYEGRRDLGNTQVGDGKRFKGRSYIQITGRKNYTAVSHALGVDFVKFPARLAEPKYAALAAAWWWHENGLNAIADSGSVQAATKRINGGYNGLADRRKYYAKAMAVSSFLVPKRRSPE